MTLSTRGRVAKSRARKFRALEPREKIDLALVALLALAAEVAVKIVSLPRLARLVGVTLIEQGREASSGRRRTSVRLDRALIDRRARTVDRLYRAWPRKGSCLRRALVLGFRIRAADPVLRIGVAKDGDAIRAHAWVEVDGEVVGDTSGDWAPLRPNQNTA